MWCIQISQSIQMTGVQEKIWRLCVCEWGLNWLTIRAWFSVGENKNTEQTNQQNKRKHLRPLISPNLVASDAAVVKKQERELESQMAEEAKAVTCNFWLGERLKWDFFFVLFLILMMLSVSLPPVNRINNPLEIRLGGNIDSQLPSPGSETDPPLSHG